MASPSISCEHGACNCVAKSMGARESTCGHALRTAAPTDSKTLGESTQPGRKSHHSQRAAARPFFFHPRCFLSAFLEPLASLLLGVCFHRCRTGCCSFASGKFFSEARRTRTKENKTKEYVCKCIRRPHSSRYFFHAFCAVLC